jgi:prepilin-type N-terminal cleavage/methylation domain-containing protein
MKVLKNSGDQSHDGFTVLELFVVIVAALILALIGYFFIQG